ncbi:uncharacterized protein LOC135144317 isoform X2 [Zophobas morio]|uniref:uncharacterized protein LOC135144317 isoform X2 n=1 Tax=Zophobas morio TaxID=2755281 RepID=UPI003082DEE9
MDNHFPLPAQVVQSTTQNQLRQFWSNQLAEVQGVCDFKNQILPLARIKKIMKLDENVKMISAEAPILFSKALEIFICELSLRAWAHTEENKRRTLQKIDIGTAVTRCDMYDFLIDIVPRDDIKAKRAEALHHQSAITMPGATVPTGMGSDPYYYYQFAPQDMFQQQQPYQLVPQPQLEPGNHQIPQNIHSQNFNAGQQVHQFQSQYGTQYM